ncbi:tRNA (adenosine(37)-N6)-threonylcarbamoyltransferase complex ATPase subunit type 1 TsaE [Roseovarius sp. SCSIO 43702]|uniref:tRNA (adenosine(37)-N6)-threonylcarbamoyltransferase complex ATPase subunit type 1 TsaE n=1 Tax=Roseovarius sp. SCSIO 43702 TaxID=2823043 RepID=UPI001C72F1C7|nr:tRNA (adenosine(37)-N6)-threonylcarbamoyltransferase complex ATPase subunit type 1 TsaE [Roseovarius sp. SCSIO 43702]QYX56975.1 tRNA (adenosine(37)-N6)-threonylcarbamoyltransferase complex ATPase subunit type 1 TsaE [Roseovarius sp. SCSIO 43702]
MSSGSVTISLPGPEATCNLARAIGAALAPGDAILLSGDTGAGKTHFCRCLIQSLLAAPEDVPSPTFTLVQTYDTPSGEIWHADLYRLGDTTELAELGLSDAFATAISLVEWPDRLGSLAPANALGLELTAGDDPEARTARLSWSHGKWQDILSRAQIDAT